MKNKLSRLRQINLHFLIALLYGLGSLFTAGAGTTLSSNEAFTFEQHEIDIGTQERQTVLTGFFLRNAVSEIAVVTLENDLTRGLRLFAFVDNHWKKMIDTTLRPNVEFVDVIRLGGQDRLISYEAGRLNLFDPVSHAESEWIAVSTIFKNPRKEEIPWVDITKDVNGDGREDLAIPVSEGFLLHVQTTDSNFETPVRVGTQTDLRGIYGTDGYRYDTWSQSRIHSIDYNRDGRVDLAFWKEDHFEVHIQNDHGLYSDPPELFCTEIPFDSDRFFTLTTGNKTGRVLHSLADMNSDGIADMVIYTLSGQRISKKRSSFSIYYGQSAEGNSTRINNKIGTTFESEDRIQLRLERRDFNRDGQMDLMLTTIERERLYGSLWKTLKGMMGDDIALNLDFHQSIEGFQTTKPNTTYRIALDGAPSHREPGSVDLGLVLRGPTHEGRKAEKTWPKAFNPNLFIGDVNGDGHDDLLFESTFRGLKIYPGMPGPTVFSPTSQSLSAIVPANQQYSWLVDLNNDGKQDLLFHHPFIERDIHGGRIHPLGTESQKVTLHIAL
ncbi:VCBS repeat-containing protein [Verrucomicrobia bacterium]|nr:VCBS repeat-containing protein [Verrucomicrobiota bacterium]